MNSQSNCLLIVSYRQSLFLHKPTNHLLVSERVAGILALRSFVSNNDKISIQSHRRLTSSWFWIIIIFICFSFLDGTGHLCINRENYSNFIFNEFRCPLSPIFTANDRYCCGSYHQQYCCSFWERYFSLSILLVFFWGRTTVCSSSIIRSLSSPLFPSVIAFASNSQNIHLAQL